MYRLPSAHYLLKLLENSKIDAVQDWDASKVSAGGYAILNASELNIASTLVLMRARGDSWRVLRRNQDYPPRHPLQ
ncbi:MULTISPECIES: hypothetical protein [Methylomonas]|uniref:Uncharacterized protein n=1 Tax=Methylomonas denitrificans TaxID=1538553 RepID=A0A126T835_9GAMM|nr:MULTISPECIES: hypothetical protein [Methylomonas]AMK77924.1 hypothetical protein JT25_015805 [Methylomonas denitrificans]OAI07767.1 hypothetical protein A1342_10835 [Methylomonas methanica]